MSEVVIELKDVGYAYPDGFVAINGVNLWVIKGERLAIVGPNGAGKSTLLMIMSGLFSPSKGNVYVFGKAATESNRIRKSVGVVFQDPDDQLFCPTLSEDVAFGPLNFGLQKEHVSARVADALRVMRLERYKDKPPHHLSAGEKKKAALATVLAMQPEILLLDEPTANLDPRSRHELEGILHELCKNPNMTLIIATHDTNFLPGLVDRALVLNTGHIIAEGSVRNVLLDPRIMDEANLEPPIIARLFHLVAEKNRELMLESIPSTVDEALYAIDRLIGRVKSAS